MFDLKKITYPFFYLLLFSPVLSYVTFGIMGLKPIGFYFQTFINIYGIFFISVNVKKVKIPTFAVFALIWAMYIIIWTLVNGKFGRAGFLGTFNSIHLAIFFILIIIYNTRISSAFISNVILIFKITVIITAVVSIIQVFKMDFLNANHLWSYLSEININDNTRYIIRRSSIFGFIDTNALGLSFMPILAVLFGYLILTKSKSIFLYLMLGGLTAFLSNARYVIGALFIIILQVMVNSKYKLKGIIRYLLVSFIILFISFQVLRYIGYDLKEWFDIRIFQNDSVKESQRYASYLVFLEVFPDNFLFGNGNIEDDMVVALSKRLGTPFIHVGYLAYLVAYGIVGCFFLYGFWFLLARKLLITAKASSFWGTFFAFLVFLWSFLSMIQSSIFYYGLIFALIFDKHFMDLEDYSV